MSRPPSIILHIPHSSRFIPKALRPSFLPSQARLDHELLLMTDAFTDELVQPFSMAAERIVFPVSRLVVDPERFPDDAVEPMAQKGMGATYTKLSSGEPLRRLTLDDRATLMSAYYYPHHAKLSAAVKAALDEHGHCLIVDVHSFGSVPLPHEPDQSVNRPEICIGFDAFHSPFGSDAEILETCRAHGFVAGINAPFSGSIVPDEFWNSDKRVRSFMIEVRRDLYMNEQTGGKNVGFTQQSERLSDLIEALIAVTAEPQHWDAKRD